MNTFDFDDILIVPTVQSEINSRTEITVLDEHNMLPLFVAPMDTVINDENRDIFHKEGLYQTMPRKNNTHYVSNYQFCFESYSMDQFIIQFCRNDLKPLTEKTYALIDVANGHMKRLTEIIKLAKQKNGSNIIIMAGNIANPYTFKVLSDAGADYIRCGIGNGGGCLTTQQTGIGFPMASLIEQIKVLKDENCLTAKIVADGGFKKYSDIIKALALGADYVMLGSILNKCLESCSENLVKLNTGYKLFDEYHKYLLENHNKQSGIEVMTLEEFVKEGVIYKNFRGMSTKEVQSSWGKKELTTSEGIVKYQQVEYTLAGWKENFVAYLKSAMSYSGAKTLEEFRKNCEIVKITTNAYNRFNK